MGRFYYTPKGSPHETKGTPHNTTQQPRLLHFISYYWNYGKPNNTTTGRSIENFWRNLRERPTAQNVPTAQLLKRNSRTRTWKMTRFALENLRRYFRMFRDLLYTTARAKNRPWKLAVFACIGSRPPKPKERLRGWNSEAWHLLRFSLQPFGFLYLTTCKNDKSRKNRNFKSPNALILERMRWTWV